MQHVGAKGTNVPPTRPGILKSTEVPPSNPKTCISRIYTCTSTIHMHSRKSTYACTHPAVPSVGLHRADGKASPHVTRTGRTKGTAVHGHGDGDGVCMYAQGALLSRRASCIQHADGRCSMRPYARPGRRQRSGRSPFVRADDSLISWRMAVWNPCFALLD
jgi:hypothetical protein